jgi:hypothetical protein
MNTILNRFPNFSAIIPVYAVISFPIFSWTTIVWFWKLPYWLNFLTAGEIGSIFSYSMVAAFFESMVVISFLLLLCFILPARIFRDRFVVRGTWLALGLTVAFLGSGVWRGFLGFSYIQFSLLSWSLASLLVILVFTIAAARFRFMARVAEWLSDRLIVFLYILIPVSMLSIIVVFIRNIF